MSYGLDMSTNDLTAPDPESIVRYIRETYPETAVLESGGTWFFSLDPERHFPNYATIVTNNDYDDGSDLDRAGVYRLNLGLSRATFERLVGDALDPAAPPDYTALDTAPPTSDLRGPALDLDPQPVSGDVPRHRRPAHRRGPRSPRRPAGAPRQELTAGPTSIGGRQHVPIE